MRLVAEGRVDLDAPVRRYAMGLQVSDEQVAARGWQPGSHAATEAVARRQPRRRAGILARGPDPLSRFYLGDGRAERDEQVVVSLSNAGLNGIPYNQAVRQWALERLLSVVEQESEPLPCDEAQAREAAGSYDGFDYDRHRHRRRGRRWRWKSESTRRSGRRPRPNCHRTTRRPSSACCPAAGTSSPRAV
jgi:hypothetical protein